MRDIMDEKQHLEYLRQKYIDLNQQFVNELKDGKSILMLKDLSSVINILLKEIEALESLPERKQTRKNT